MDVFHDVEEISGHGVIATVDGKKGYGRKYQTYENDGYPLFQGRADRYYCTCCC